MWPPSHPIFRPHLHRTTLNFVHPRYHDDHECFNPDYGMMGPPPREYLQSLLSHDWGFTAGMRRQYSDDVLWPMLPMGPAGVEERAKADFDLRRDTLEGRPDYRQGATEITVEEVGDDGSDGGNKHNAGYVEAIVDEIKEDENGGVETGEPRHPPQHPHTTPECAAERPNPHPSEHEADLFNQWESLLHRESELRNREVALAKAMEELEAERSEVLRRKREMQQLLAKALAERRRRDMGPPRWERRRPLFACAGWRLGHVGGVDGHGRGQGWDRYGPHLGARAQAPRVGGLFGM